MDWIEKPDDQDRLIIRNSIKFLDNLTHLKQLNVPTLQSLYRTKCRLMELRRQIYLPAQKPYHRCQQCFMNFSEGKTKFEVRPAKLSCFAKKIVTKVKNSAILTSYQKIYYKKMLKKYPNGFQNQNKLILTCNFCEKETVVWMAKPKPKQINPKNVNTPAKKKKKAKKKDKFCGLDESVVFLSSTKKSKEGVNADKSINTNTPTSLDNTNVFVTHEKTKMNASVSMTNTRLFPTSEFIDLVSNTKGKSTIKFSKKKENTRENVNKPDFSGLTKSKEKLQKKNINSLSNILKKASENKSRPITKLKDFLASL